MSSPTWTDLLINVERLFPSMSEQRLKLTPDQAEQLQAAANAGESFNTEILSGLAAVGELIAHASATQGLDDSASLRLGWLVSSLANLSLAMSEAAGAANFRLQQASRQGGASK